MFGLRQKISPEQVDEWMAFDAIEPIGNEQLYAMLALLGSNLAATQLHDMHPSQFYPRKADDEADDPDEPMSDEELKLALARLAR